MLDDTELDSRLAALGDVAPVPAAELVRARVAVLGARRRRSRIRRTWIGGGSALVLLAGLITAPAAADAIHRYLADTGIPCRGTECGVTAPHPSGGGSSTSPEPSPDPSGSGDADGSGDLIDLTAPDLNAYIASQRPDYVPVPPGMTVAEFVARVQKANPGVTPPSGSNTGYYAASSIISGSYKELSYCSWLAEWMTADDHHDLGQRDRATAVVVAAAHWPTIGQAGDLARLQVGYSAGAARKRRRTSRSSGCGRSDSPGTCSRTPAGKRRAGAR